MSKARNKFIALALVGGGAFAAYSLLAGPDAQDGAAKAEHLVNQVWLERLPQHERDMIGHLLVLDHPRARIGVVGKSSQWRHFIEAFKWALEGDRLLTVFPQERARAQFKVKTWHCEGDAPHPFELCLQVSRGDRKAVFYSREDWVVEPQDAEGSLAELAEEYPELAGVYADVSESDAARMDAVDPDAMAEVDGAWLLD
jgi:hypothetical protein